MKEFIKRICLLLVLSSVICLCACANGDTSTKTYEIAVIIDVGYLMDGGFNEGTFEGAKAYATQHNLTYQYYQPANNTDATDNDRIAVMRQAISNGAKVILAVGFLQASAIDVVAKENPDVKFIFVDGWTMGLDNVTAIMYKEEESGYMAGYAAVKDGYTKLGTTLGGGGSSPACNRFGYGYMQGISDASKEEKVNVQVKYSYKYGENFIGSNELQTQISSWYANGTEVVFACGGAMFESVKSAAEETTNGKIIGVDVDQSSLSERVITSAIKNLKTSVYLILSEIYDGKWEQVLSDKASNLGVIEDATGLAMDSARMSHFDKNMYDELFNKIKSGDIKIDSDVPDDCNNRMWIDERFSDNPYLSIDFER